VKNYQNEIKVSLKIHDFFCDASEITSILGISPTETWKKGEPTTQRGIVKYKSNGWVYRIIRNDVVLAGEVIDELINIFKDKLSNFEKLPQECYIEFSIVGFLDKGMPSFFFGKQNIGFLHAIGAEIDFDLYGL
jgi:hypothetical protein